MYKVEKYIEKCLTSCLTQDIPITDYEIVCVNDGSPDASEAIAMNYAKQYSNIKIISQSNLGLSMARNNGLKVAIGEYVWFVDSDDWIENNCLKRIISRLYNNVDILQLQYRYTYEDSDRKKEFYPIVIDGVKSGVEIMSRGGLPAPAQFCIYRRVFLIENGLEFVPGIYHEDSEFKPRVVYTANRISSDDVICYNYLQRQSGNIMSSFSEKRANDILFVNARLYDFSKQVDRRCLTTFYRMIGTNMNTLLYGYRELDNSKKVAIKQMIAKNTVFFQCMMKSHNIKYFIEGLLFCIDLNLGLKFHTVFKH